MYIYTYIYVYICVCVYIYTYIHVCVCVCVYIYTYVHIHIHIHIRTHIHIHIRIHIQGAREQYPWGQESQAEQEAVAARKALEQQRDGAATCLHRPFSFGPGLELVCICRG